jgi:murein tripeptide amidase MpaA
MHISAPFDAGNIRVVDATDPADIQLEIVRDGAADHLQWFYFRVSGARGVPLRLRLTNAHATSYPKAWEGYHAAYSTDQEQWLRETNTRYEDGALVIEHTPAADAVWFAYFAPYPLERHQRMLGRWQQRAELVRLGSTVDGLDLDRLQVGAPGEGKRVIWVIARQHPGESMAQWWMEGFVERLLDRSDPLAQALLEQAVFYIVPNMNPDGSRRGHLRTNAAGANLNREWHEPSVERSPEVYWVRHAMDATGCDLCLDVHGDEELPYNFVSGAEGIPGWTERLANLQARFLAAYIESSPDFQTEHGYSISAPGEANLTMCTNQIAQRFDCLAMTLEMPFKDNADRPQPDVGWSPARAMRLGEAVLHPMMQVLSSLR